MSPAAGGSVTQQGLDLRPRHAIARHQQLPWQVGQQGKRAGQHVVGGQLVARSHHRGHHHPGLVGRRQRTGGAQAARAPGRACARHAGTAPDRETAQALDPGARRRSERQSGDIMGSRAQQQVGLLQRVEHRGLAHRPRPGQSLGRVRRLGDHVRQSQRTADGRSDPVGRLVIQMVGEPEVGRRAVRRIAPARDQCPCRLQAGLAHGLLVRGIAGAVERTQLGNQLDGVTRDAQGVHQQARHAPVARCRFVGRRLQGRVEGNSHGAL